MTQQNTTACQQAASIQRQLTEALVIGDQLRRQRVELDRKIEDHETQVTALLNISAGIDLGKRAEAERLAAEDAAKVPSA